MQFKSLAAQAMTVYDLANIDGKYVWTESRNEYVNAGEIITVDFDHVIESYFTRDYLAGAFVAVDAEAQAWAKPLAELVWDAIA